MRNNHKCKQCECYSCDRNDCCFECLSCIDNDYFVDVYDSKCPDRIEDTDF